MENSEKGEGNDANPNLESEGLSGINFRVEEHNLRVDGLPTFFSDGKGTRKEPLIPMPNVHLRDALENAKGIAELVEEYDLKRIMFIRHNDRLLGIDSGTHVQLVRDKKWSPKQLKEQISLIENLLNSLKERDKELDKWTLSIIDEE